MEVDSAMETEKRPRVSEGASNEAMDTNGSASDIDLPEKRFEMELEFLQMLASPAYLHFLAVNEYLNDENFIEFLEYLSYWKRPEYVKYITYPHALFFLDQLTYNERFRRELKQVPFRDFVHQQQFESWRYRCAQLYGLGSKEKDINAQLEGSLGESVHPS